MQPPLKPLHDESLLSKVKLATLEKVSTPDLLESLQPGNVNALTAKPDGTILEGHHRIKILRDRGINVDTLPRELKS